MFNYFLMPLRCFALCAALVTSACGDDTAVANIETKDLSSARDKWADRGSADYTMVYRVMCFCPLGSVTVVVRDGKVMSAVFSPSNSPGSPTRTVSNPYTVARLFDLTDRALTEAATLNVRFDVGLAYPEYLSIDWDLRMADEEITILVDRLTLS